MWEFGRITEHNVHQAAALVVLVIIYQQIKISISLDLLTNPNRNYTMIRNEPQRSTPVWPLPLTLH